MSTEEGYRELRKYVRDVLVRSGAVGGVMIFHPFRRLKGSDGQWYESPHFHCIVMGWTDSRKIPTGWILKVKYRQGKNKIPTEELYRTAYYLVSHAGAVDGMTVPFYFGTCSTAGKNSKVTVAEFTETRYRTCGTKGCPDGYLYLYPDWLRHRRFGDELHPIEDVWTWKVWCLRKNSIEVSQLIEGKTLDEVLDISDPRIFIEHPNGFSEIEKDTDGEGVTLGYLDEDEGDPADDQTNGEGVICGSTGPSARMFPVIDSDGVFGESRFGPVAFSVIRNRLLKRR